MPLLLLEITCLWGRADESHPFLSTAIFRVYCHVRGSMSCSVKVMTDRRFSLDLAAVRTKTHTQWLSPKQWSRTSRRPSPCSTRRDTVSTTLNVSWNYCELSFEIHRPDAKPRLCFSQISDDLLLISTGVIDVASLAFVMKAIGLDPSDAELHNMITEVDGSGTCAICRDVCFHACIRHVS